MFADHWVAWSQVAGLMVGLFGLFFVSVDIVGDTFTRWLIALLPATGVGLGWALLFVPLTPVLASMSQTHFSQSDLRWFQVGIVFMSFFAGYDMTLMFLRTREKRMQRAKSESSSPIISRGEERVARIIAVILVAVLPAIITLFLYLNHTLNDGSVQTAIVLDIGWAIYTGCFFVLARMPLNFNGKRLQTIGIGLTVFAVITQFFPPVGGFSAPSSSNAPLPHHRIDASVKEAYSRRARLNASMHSMIHNE